MFYTRFGAAAKPESLGRDALDEPISGISPPRAGSAAITAMARMEFNHALGAIGRLYVAYALG